MRRKTIAATVCMALATSAAAIEPGQWRSTTQIVEVTMPETMPAQVAQLVRQQLGDRALTSANCITQDEIDNAPERMFAESQGRCEYSRFDMADGTIQAAAQCQTDQGTMDMTMHGTYTASAYAMTMEMQAQTPMGAMTFTSDISGERTGPCS